MFTLWPYQREAVDALLTSQLTRPATVLPTGSGKTVIFSDMIKTIVGRGGRPLVLVHRDELARQSKSKILAMNPGLDVGVIQAGQNEVNAGVLVGSVWTLGNQNRLDQITGITDVIVDECHHATANTYLRVLRHLGSFDQTKTYGFTATMVRASGNRNLGDVWEDVVYSKSILWMIRNGYLVEPTGYTVDVPDLDLSGVKTSGGDFSVTDLGDALQTSQAAVRIVEAWQDKAAGKRTAVFCPTVANAHQLADAFLEAGVPTEVVTGDTDTEVRQGMYERLASGKTLVLCNCMVLTEGWDEPSVECVVVARPTKSPGLYIQIVGRGLRLSRATGKTGCIVLDVVGNARNMSLCSMTTLTQTNPKRRANDGEGLLKATKRYADEDEIGALDPLVAPDIEELKLEKISLFDESEFAFQQTDGGTWFAPSSKRYFWIWPVTGGFIVRSTESQYKIGRSVLHVDVDNPVDLSFAMDLIDSLIAEDDRTSRFGTTKSAAWKKRKPSMAAINLGVRYGVVLMHDGREPFIPAGLAFAPNGKPLGLDGQPMTAGEMSRRIDLVRMNRWLGPHERKR